jgi:hypothetical protein
VILGTPNRHHVPQAKCSAGCQALQSSFRRREGTNGCISAYQLLVEGSADHQVKACAATQAVLWVMQTWGTLEPLVYQQTHCKA